MPSHALPQENPVFFKREAHAEDFSGKANDFSDRGKEKISLKNLSPCRGNHFSGKEKDFLGKAEDFLGKWGEFPGQENLNFRAFFKIGRSNSVRRAPRRW